MSSIKERVQDAGQAVADTAKGAGHKIADGAEKAVDWVKDKVAGGDGASGIREHMDVIGCCGTKIGTVDHCEGDAIKLTRSGSPDGQHHFIPVSWVDRVDQHVHLKRNSAESMRDWKNEASACGSCGA